MNLFDDYGDDDNEKELEETTDRDELEKILKRAKLKFTETSNEEFEDILKLKNDVGFAFDEYGALLYVIAEVGD